MTMAPAPDRTAARLIGAPMQKPLDAALWRLVTGEIGLQDLTPGLMGFYTLGHDAGMQAAQSAAQERADALQRECDMWYFVANNRGKKPGDWYRAQTERLWQEAYR